MKVRIAVTPPTAILSGPEFVAYLEACETMGFDTVWLSDIPLGPGGDPVISLSIAAAATTRLKLGANIVPLGRNPLWLAKQLAQLDRLSGGRLLLSFVPGLGAPAERAALGLEHGNRGAAVDNTIGLLRTWWAGGAVSAAVGPYVYEDLRLEPRPLQAPLEIWLGGKAPQALSRVARLADGWLTSLMTPDEAAHGRRAIESEATDYGRRIDHEHFGISIPATRGAMDDNAVAGLRRRREDGELEQIIAVGSASLRDLLRAHIDAGLSKFVVRSVEPESTAGDWHAQLGWLAEQALPLQT